MISPASYISNAYRASSANTKIASNTFLNNKLESPSTSRSYDTVELSDARHLGIKLPPILLPTMENVRELSAELESMTGKIFRANGISNDPPVVLSMNGDGLILVEGDHPKANRIADLLNADKDFKDLFHTLEALSSHAHAFQESLKFQAEYRASGGAPYVVSKYSHLFGKQAPQSITMQFGSSGLDILFNGKVWDTSEQTSGSGTTG